ncbi:MAG: carbonic anhydrase [Sphaerochaetaceae bacterium]|nr:carbonic anhydrase [Sphaerochaetaceae bacterium]
MFSAEQAITKLLEGNSSFLNTSKEIRTETAKNGQHPYAIIITCSDSRVIPEAIFNAGIGELFVIRVAGNVIDNHQLGSIEYASEHLGTKLIMVLGHTHCGAVDAAINHDPEGYIKYITDDIRKAIGKERDPYKACCLNVKHCVSIIESSLEIQKEEKEGLKVVGAVYDIETGKVKLLGHGIVN